MTITLTKAVPAELKAASGERNAGHLAEGEFTALVAVFGNVDSYGDVVMPGAFAKSIAASETSGNPIPVVWSHRWEDPFSHIGEVTKAEETSEGLLVTCRIDTDTEQGAQIYRLLKSRRIRQFSFAFDIRPDGAAWATRIDPITGAEYEVFELRDLALHEVGPCLVGVNRDTQLESVKAAHAEFTASHRNPPTTDDEAADEAQRPADQAGDTSTDDSPGQPGDDAASGREGTDPVPPASDDERSASVEALEAELTILNTEGN